MSSAGRLDSELSPPGAQHYANLAKGRASHSGLDTSWNGCWIKISEVYAHVYSDIYSVCRAPASFV